MFENLITLVERAVNALESIAASQKAIALATTNPAGIGGEKYDPEAKLQDAWQIREVLVDVDEVEKAMDAEVSPAAPSEPTDAAAPQRKRRTKAEMEAARAAVANPPPAKVEAGTVAVGQTVVAQTSTGQVVEGVVTAISDDDQVTVKGPSKPVTVPVSKIFSAEAEATEPPPVTEDELADIHPPKTNHTAATPKVEAKAVSRDDVRKLASSLMAKPGGTEKVKAILAQVGEVNITSAKEANLATIADLLAKA